MKIWGLTIALIGLQSIAQIPAILTGNSQPKTAYKSMGECLKGIVVSPIRDAGQINIDNNKIYGCITIDYKDKSAYAVPTEHFVCMNGAKRILDNQEMKKLAMDHCNEHFYETIPCVRGAEKLTEQAMKQKKTRECVEKNASYFPSDFCIEFLKKAGLTKEQDLIQACMSPQTPIGPNGREEKSNQK